MKSRWLHIFIPFVFIACSDGQSEPPPDACSPEAEVCDGIDNDCDAEIDESPESGGILQFADMDDDGFGQGTPQRVCAVADGFVEMDGDCNDNDASIFPGATEVCDGVDQDCNGVADDGLPTQTFFLDRDDDTFGGESVEACAQPNNAVAVGGDCNDADASINPSAIDICDGVDQDCSGTADDQGRASIGGTLFDSLQDALDQSSSSFSEEIQLCAGEHPLPNAAITSQVHLTGRPDGSSLVRQSDTSTGGFVVRGPGRFIVENVAFEGTNGTLISSPEGKNVELTNVAVSGFDTVVAVESNSSFIARVVIQECEFVNSPRALHVTGNVDLRIANTNFRDGVFTIQTPTPTDSMLYAAANNFGVPSVIISDVSFNNNRGSYGLVTLVNATPFIMALVASNLLFDNNTTLVSGAIYGSNVRILGESNSTIKNHFISANSSAVFGAIHVEDGSRVEGFTVEDSVTPNGAGVYARDSFVGDVLIQNNGATSAGGGIYLENSVLRDSVVRANQARLGGGVYVPDNSSSRVIDSNIVGNSSTESGGGIYVGDGARLEVSGIVHGNASAGSGPGASLGLGVIDSTADWGQPGTSNDNGPPDIEFVRGDSVFAFNAWMNAFVLDCSDGPACTE